MTATQTINLVAAALGGEGGGVFTNWVIDVAERENWICQTTSLAGVAQRTGATIYYMELFPGTRLTGAKPVLSLFPAQGDIDIAIASEIAEAGRMVQRGFVSTAKTTLIASDHRVYGITEKVDLGDGTIDPLVLQDIAQRYSKKYIHYDMLALANEHGAVISAVLLGALAGSATLPFAKASFIAAIEAGGKAVATNLAAFEASFQRAQSSGIEGVGGVGVCRPAAEASWPVPASTTEQGRELLHRVKRLPASCHEVLYHALVKLVDYQDYAYAHQYLDELQDIVVADNSAGDYELSRETARWLALWMCFEDIPRVAQIKTRANRMHEVRKEVKADTDQLFHVSEFFRPRVEEMCALLPPKIGKWVVNSAACYRFLQLFTGGRQLSTNTITIYLTLRFLAGLRRFRRGMLGYQREQAKIQQWLLAIRARVQSDSALALELSACGRLIKGYGDTRQNTTARLLSILERVDSTDASAALVKRWRQAALQDEAARLAT